MIIQNNSASNTIFGTNNAKDKEKSDVTSFDEFLTAPKTESQIAKEKTQQLMDDIRSVMRTGMTEQELEELEAKIAEIQKRIKEASKGENISMNQITSMMDEIEKLILEVQKDVYGVVIKEAENNSSLNLVEASGSEMASLNQRVQEALTSINTLKENKPMESVAASTHEKVNLMEEFKELKTLDKLVIK